VAYEITIGDDALEATFVPEVGMVGNSLRHEGEELLFQRDGLAAYAEHGSVFGIPLLHPFANRLSAWDFELAGRRVKLDPDSPIAHWDAATGTAIHGLLAASPHWKVVDADRALLIAELDFAAVPQYMAAFPFAHTVRYAASVADATLTVKFTVRASAEQAVPVSFGFHPYLTLPGSDRREWQVQIPVASRGILDERMIPTGQTEPVAPGELDGPLGDRTFDTSYPSLYGVAAGGSESPPTFSLADDTRRISLRHVSGYPVSQVYAPENSDFICFEPMTAPIDALISGAGLNWVQPAGEFTATFTISVE
jgi:galactose mutarotase-like enzyme